MLSYSSCCHFCSYKLYDNKHPRVCVCVFVYIVVLLGNSWFPRNKRNLNIYLWNKPHTWAYIIHIYGLKNNCEINTCKSITQLGNWDVTNTREAPLSPADRVPSLTTDLVLVPTFRDSRSPEFRCWHPFPYSLTTHVCIRRNVYTCLFCVFWPVYKWSHILHILLWQAFFYSLYIMFLGLLDTWHYYHRIVFLWRTISLFIDFAVLEISIISNFCSTKQRCHEHLVMSPGAHM